MRETLIKFIIIDAGDGDGRKVEAFKTSNDMPISKADCIAIKRFIQCYMFEWGFK